MTRLSRPVSWLKAALKDFGDSPQEAQEESRRLGIAAEGIEMANEKLELVHGSGNLFRDLGDPDADVKQLESILAAEIIKRLDHDGLSVRKAQQQTGIDASDFTRIRNAKLDRFTVDRLMTVVNRLGSRVDVAVKVRRLAAGRPALA